MFLKLKKYNHCIKEFFYDDSFIDYEPRYLILYNESHTIKVVSWLFGKSFTDYEPPIHLI